MKRRGESDSPQQTGGITMKNTLSLRCAAAVAAITMTSIGLAPTAFAADPPATTSPVGAISGSWGSGCETITVNSGGWAAGD